MRFTISREKLQEGLAAVTAAVPAKTTLPVLSNLLVETTERGIRLSATDLDIAVSTEVSADVETPGAITIPAKKLSEIARELFAEDDHVQPHGGIVFQTVQQHQLPGSGMQLGRVTQLVRQVRQPFHREKREPGNGERA